VKNGFSSVGGFGTVNHFGGYPLALVSKPLVLSAMKIRMPRGVMKELEDYKNVCRGSLTKLPQRLG
jgi:hypothetical protein